MADIVGDGQRYAEAAGPAVAGPVMSEQLRALIDDAVSAFGSYKENLGSNNFADAGSSLEELNSLLQEIEDETSDAAPETSGAPAGPGANGDAGGSN